MGLLGISALQASAELVREFVHMRFFDYIQMSGGDLVDLYATAGQHAPTFNQIN
jgi:hypothetical protein